MTGGDELDEKYAKLRDYLSDLGSVAVAFSGGVDSSLLARVAHDELGDRMLAVTAEIRSLPGHEAAEAERFCREQGIPHAAVRFDELTIPGFGQNPVDRCYLCKSALLAEMGSLARDRGMAWLAEGSNVDDEGDYRPGMRAVAESGALSPLRAAGLGKADIRELARHLGLPTWDKPSSACLSSRFAYGEAITAEKLERVELAEAFLRERGFDQLRVRIHGSGGEIARIEVPEERIAQVTGELRADILRRFEELGFVYVTVDLAGFRSGSGNAVLDRATAANTHPNG